MEILKPKSIQCEYKGYTMRSILEKKIAEKLDDMGIRWYYEPQGFKMADGTCYLPDFYLPDIKIWIEGKGIMTEEDTHKCNCFIKENENREPLLIVFSDGKIEIMGAYKTWGYYEEDLDKVDYKLYQDYGVKGFTCSCDSFSLVKCIKCGNFYVQSQEDDYTCLFCNAYEGDHFREVRIDNNDNFFELNKHVFD